MAGRSGCANMATTTLVALALMLALGAVVLIFLADQLRVP
jgi:hypothetical protein